MADQNNPRARHLLGLCLLLFACSPAREAALPEKNPPVILISIDTLRSDRLPAYGYRAVATPHIDRLAADGVVYEEAFSHVPLTLPSHATIFTGQLPPQHGVRDNAGYRLADAETLATTLRTRGYATGGAVSAYVLRGETGIAHGFESWDDEIPFIEGAPTGNLQRAGRETVAIANRFIAANASRPFFAFVHLFEPHAPYDGGYDAEIARSDEAVGELLAALRNAGLYDDALIVLLSDHGEGLMDHGEQEHGVLLYREALQVPLIVKLPNNAQRGTRVNAPIGLKDIRELILAAITGQPADRLTGQPLYAETLYPQIHLGWSALHSIVRHPHHLIEGPKPELYNLVADPRETRNLRDEQRRVYTQLRADLAAVPQPAAAQPRIDPEEAKKLAALGYVSARSPAQQSNLNPRDHLGDLIELKAITEAMDRRDFAGAASRIETLLARNPGWSDLRDQLGVAYEAMGNLPAAERVYRDGIRITPELAEEFAISLASVLLARDEIDEAEAHARVALDSNPAAAHELLAQIEIARGRFDAAMSHADVVRNSDPFRGAFVAAHVHAAANRPEPALRELQRMYNDSRAKKLPLPRDFFFFTGDLFARIGRIAEAREAFERQLAQTPDNRDAYVRLALLHRVAGDLPAARRTLDLMIERNPDEATRRLAMTVWKEWGGTR